MSEPFKSLEEIIKYHEELKSSNGDFFIGLLNQFSGRINATLQTHEPREKNWKLSQRGCVQCVEKGIKIEELEAKLEKVKERLTKEYQEYVGYEDTVQLQMAVEKIIVELQ